MSKDFKVKHPDFGHVIFYNVTPRQREALEALIKENYDPIWNGPSEDLLPDDIEENILSVNDPLPGEENDKWEDDPDVMAFLEMQDEPGPWSEEDDKIYTVGGLTADKDRDFMKFQDKMNENDKKNQDKDE